MKSRLHEIWEEYRSEFWFGLGLLCLTVLSYWLGSYIPESVFENTINPMEYIGTFTVCFWGAYMSFAHLNQNKIRQSWAWVLVIWGVLTLTLFVMQYVLHIKMIGTDLSNPLYPLSVTIGNVIALLLFIYPTQVLCPGWLNWRRVGVLVLPMVAVGVADCFVAANLLPLILLFPGVIFILLCRHVRKYRQWCEDNFSSMEDIDAQWIVRYLMMLLIVGVAFYFIVFYYLPNRLFTQQWLLLMILLYTTERVLFRPDPWEKLKERTKDKGKGRRIKENGQGSEYKEALERWIKAEKPYLNPDFQLSDLHEVLPINRTYISHFINHEYGCSFYHWVNGLRIEEAKRMMVEKPDMLLQEVAERCGFSSRNVFTRAFTRAAGCSPSEWLALRMKSVSSAKVADEDCQTGFGMIIEN